MKKAIILMLIISMSLLVTRGLYAAPYLIINNGLVLEEGGDGLIGSTNLEAFDDVYSAEQLTYTIVHTPINGNLFVNSDLVSPGTTFTQQDINNDLLVYTHDGNEGNTDYFVFSVSNPSSEITWGPAFEFTIYPYYDQPILINNSYLYVNNCDFEIIGTGQLWVSDIDSIDADISYYIDTLPSNGDLYVNDVLAYRGSTFTQLDVYRNNVKYVHNCSDTTSDYFMFSVIDDDVINYNDRDISDQIFNINVLNEEILRNELSQCQAQLDQCLNEPQIQPEGKGKTCFDGIDNDGDSLTDCDDPGCSLSKKCSI